MFRDILKVQEAASIYGNPGLRFQILSRRGARWMGYVSVYNARWNVHSAAMDYYLLNQYWGQGIALQAVMGILSYCWTDLGLHRVEAQVDVDNRRSIRFAERLRLVYEGIRRDGAYVNRRWRDHRIYSALATDPVLGHHESNAPERTK